MKNFILLLLAFIIFSLIGVSQVTSNFNVDAEGWHSQGDGNSYWESSAGNPGGSFRLDDDATGDMNRAYAPVKFLGNWSTAKTSDYISADIFLHQINGPYVTNNFVFRISGPGGSANAIISPEPPFDTWTTYFVYLGETEWTVDPGDSWNAILENVTTFIVTMEYITGDEYNRMDNVQLSLTPGTYFPTPVILSDFESGAGGWSFINAGPVSVDTTGGHPGKYLKVNDASGIISLAVPPSIYHGNWTQLDNHNAEIMIDYKITEISGSLLTPDFLIKISGPGGVATYPWDNSIMNAFNRWYSLGIPIEQTGWTLISGDWNLLMNYVTDIQLAAEFIYGSETVGIDNFSISNLPPDPEFTVDKTFIFSGQSVQFQDNSSSAPSTWLWDFGDGTTSNEVNPEHQYISPGIYTVSLTTTNHFGSNTETKYNHIEVTTIEDCFKFSDDFNDNTINQTWWLKNGTWSEDGGNIRQTSNFYTQGNLLGGCFAITGSIQWEDNILTCDLMSTDNDNIGLVWNWQDEQNMYMFYWNSQDNRRRIVKWVNGVETILAEEVAGYIMDTWYHVDVYSIDGTQVIAIDGTEIFGVVDYTFPGGKAGLFCSGNDESYWDDFKVECTGTPVNLKVFLEGPFSHTGTEMNTWLNFYNYLSLVNHYTSPPWNHTGTEAVLSFPPDVVDWVLVDFRDATSAGIATATTSVATNAALLLKNGQIVSAYNGLPLYLNHHIENNLYIAIFHRNHLGILSANPLIESGGIYFYDFTTGSDNAYGVDAQKDFGGEVFGMLGGDANANGSINDDDMIGIWTDIVGSGGYLKSDHNLDGQVDNEDKNDYWLLNIGNSSQVPE